MAKKKVQEEDNLQELESALTKTERFIEDNQKVITYAVGALILVVVVYLGFSKFYLQPREQEAQSQMFMAESYFEKDSFNLALNGDGNYLGFLDIIDDYGITESANLAKYYSGVSYLHLGNFEEALDYLNDFDTDDLLLEPIVAGAKGDAHLELGETDKALKQYKKAYSVNDNELTSPVYMMKAAQLLETMDEPEEALAIYKRIKEEYPETAEGRNVERYIARVETKLG
ncbi:MAG TPA: tetratricopeptide repeat protein [Prolixibacteraceae bacterium]|nr:tetratricopeptide repeat protein [Prolixibacteraceae bacterium]